MNERAFRLVYNMVRGDSVWCDWESAWNEACDPERSISESRRMFYNQVWMAEGRLYSPEDWKRIEANGDLEPGDTICLGFDGGKSDDATALMAIRVSDGLSVPLLLEERPAEWEGHWEVNREIVESAVHKAFRDYNVVAFMLMSRCGSLTFMSGVWLMGRRWWFMLLMGLLLLICVVLSVVW